MGTPITDYTTLAAAIATWDERTHDADEIIGLAEAAIRNALGPSYAREASTTISTSSSGVASLPSGFIRPVALTHATYGQIRQRTIAEVRQRIAADGAGVPDIFALTGSTILVAPTYEGDLTLDHEAILTGLSASNTTNWLITTAPHVYLSMCLSVAKAKFEDQSGSESYQRQAFDAIGQLRALSIAAQFGTAEMSPDVAMP